MDNVGLRQQFKINAMHGHDVGVWVCEGSGISLSPVLFMQALCPEPVPRPYLVKWKAATVPPKAFRKDAALPLIYSECGRLPPWPYHLHLFSSQAPVTRVFEQTSDLHDWAWAVPLIGIILIFNQKYDRPPSMLSLDWLFNRSSSPKRSSPFAWVQDQQLPCIVAALGYEDAADIQQLRSRYGLTDDIPVLPGPALADARRQNPDTQSGMFSSVFEHQKLVFDREYARAVLDGLLKQIERTRSAA